MSKQKEKVIDKKTIETLNKIDKIFTKMTKEINKCLKETKKKKQ